MSNRRAAICRALAAAEPGDCVLIAGKRRETNQTIGRRRVPPDDREVVREWLYRGQRMTDCCSK
jgi:UDP-N-acetylmuramoyl-L-alanyl-D-glutamate--2,6-diaminopimelate ligase